MTTDVDTTRRTAAVPATASEVVTESKRDRFDRAWLAERIDGWVAIAVAIAWFVLNEIAIALEPATSHEVPVIGVVLSTVMWVLVGAMVAGLVVRRRWGLVASFAASVFLTAAAIACPTTGHHAMGAWWFGQMACALGLVAVTGYALLRAPVADVEHDA